MLGWHLYLLAENALESGFHGSIKGDAALKENMVADVMVFNYLVEIVFDDGIGKAAEQVLGG